MPVLVTAHIGGLILSDGSEPSEARGLHEDANIVALDMEQKGAQEDLDELATWARNADHLAANTSEEERNVEDVKYVLTPEASRTSPSSPIKAPPTPTGSQCGTDSSSSTTCADTRLRMMPYDSDWKPIRIPRTPKRFLPGRSKSHNLGQLRKLLPFSKKDRDSTSITSAEDSSSMAPDMETVRSEWRRQNHILAEGEFENNTSDQGHTPKKSSSSSSSSSKALRNEWRRQNLILAEGEFERNNNCHPNSSAARQISPKKSSNHGNSKTQRKLHMLTI